MISCGMQDALDQIIHWLGLSGALFAAIGGMYFGFESVEGKLNAKLIYAITWAPVALTVPFGWVLTLLLDPATAHNRGYEWTLTVLGAVAFLLVLARFFVFQIRAVPHESSVRSRAWGWSFLILGFVLLLFQQVVDTTFMYEKRIEAVAKCQA